MRDEWVTLLGVVGVLALCALLVLVLVLLMAPRGDRVPGWTPPGPARSLPLLSMGDVDG